MCNKYFYFLYRLVFGTLFPAYCSYKAVKNRDVREYSRWMMYWIVFAIFTFAELFTDIFIGLWFPFYYEIKIVFVLWLMYGNGSRVVYLHFVHPQLTRYEQTIDSYIDSLKQMGVRSFALVGRKVIDVFNKSLVYLLQSTQYLIFYHMQSHTITESHIQSQRLLTQSRPPTPPNFIQQFFTRSPTPSHIVEPQPPSPSSAPDSVDGSPVRPNPLSQRWYSEEVLNLTIAEGNFANFASPSTSNPMNLRLRTRSESESNLDDWERMDVQEVKGKPPVQPIKSKKRTKAVKIDSPGDRPKRKTRAAAAKARAKCKDVLPEDLSEEN